MRACSKCASAHNTEPSQRSGEEGSRNQALLRLRVHRGLDHGVLLLTHSGPWCRCVLVLAVRAGHPANAVEHLLCAATGWALTRAGTARATAASRTGLKPIEEDDAVLVGGVGEELDVRLVGPHLGCLASAFVLLLQLLLLSHQGGRPYTPRSLR